MSTCRQICSQRCQHYSKRKDIARIRRAHDHDSVVSFAYSNLHFLRILTLFYHAGSVIA